MNRRTLLSLSTLAVVGSWAKAKSNESEIQAASPDIEAHWKHRTAAIMLQKQIVSERPELVVFGDSRIEGLPSLKVSGQDAVLWGFGGMSFLSAANPIATLQNFGYRPKTFVSVVGVNTVGGECQAMAREEGSSTQEWLKRKEAVDLHIHMITALSPKPTICTVVPYEEGFAVAGISTDIAKKSARLAAEINSIIVDAATRHGVHVLDLHAMMTNAAGTARAGLTCDGVHWSAAGASKFAEALAQRI